MKKIILAGYMASGKTTTGSLAALTLGLKHYDLDTLMERHTAKSIPQLFTEKGEVYFRKTEHELLKTILDTGDSFVLSLGGGTPCYANNHLFLRRDDVVSVYLRAGIDELVKRLQGNTAYRPQVAGQDGGTFREFVAKHLFDRSWYYYQAKHIINVDDKTPGAVVEQIIQLVS
ncbi:shikimate kinase [Flavobacterium cyanobacteriorum]|uniref:Shikimate kinase n=1 Tax=Flavobacterium cyanobacteriorum TaxID=2022802 RepID=A0A256A132_9FLAO|nr:shikimate kinase [Flavobacterium cyanobacteriorum]OYQ47433.1 shikimate kinase [Flavobacterium cyanobacteriorum]